MANKAQIDVVERRIRPVYEQMDMGKFKKAAAECDRLLKKQPDFNCAFALKALCHIRMNRREEAETIITMLSERLPLDEHTLQALAYCFRDLQQPERTVQLYESAHKAKPDNEELLAQLFIACVRVGDFKKQYQTAMQLYKLTNKILHFYWAVLSLVLQGTSDPELGAKASFPLAKRMLEKLGRFQTEGQFRLYLLVLERLKDFDEAFMALMRADYQEARSTMWDLDLAETHYLQVRKDVPATTPSLEQKKHAELQMKCMELLTKENGDCLDQWVLYLRLMDVWFELNAPIEKLFDFIVALQDRSRRLDKPVRSPFLALLELIKQLRQRNLSSPALNQIDAFLLYFDEFGSKPCCFGDLLYYFRAFFERDSAIDLIDQFLAALSGKNSEATCRVPQLDVNIRTIQAYFAMRKPNFDAKSLVVNLLNAYANQIPGKEENLGAEAQPNNCEKTSSSPTPADGFLWLAVQILWPKVDSHPMEVLKVIRILEAALEKSPENYFFRISLGKLYFLLGAASTGIDVIDRLDVKYCQRESMAYLLYDQMSVWGTPKGVTLWCQGLQQFFRISDREANEMLLQAYKNGSFVQAIEFTRFREQLTDTLHRTATLIEFPYYACLLDVGEFDHLGEVLHHAPSPRFVDFSRIIDVRDFAVLDPLLDQQIGDEFVRRSHDEKCDVLKLHMLMMNSVKKLVELAITKDDSDMNGFAPLMAHYMRCRLGHSVAWEFSVKSPPPSHFDLFVKGEYFEVLRFLLQMLPEMIMDRPAPEGTAEALKSALKVMISRHQFAQETVDFFPYRQIVHLSFCTQATGWAVLMGLVGRKGLAWQFAGVPKSDGVDVHSPSSGGAKKGKKKTAVIQQNSNGSEKEKELSTSAQTFLATFSTLQTAIDSLARMVDDLRSILETGICQLNFDAEKRIEDPLDEAIGKISGGMENLRKRIEENLRCSYERSLSALQNLLKHQNEVLEKEVLVRQK